MKIVFFGSAHFAVPALEALINSDYELCCIVTQPDKKKGRHLHLAGTDIKTLSEKSGLCILQPKDINSAESVKLLSSFNPDLFVIVAYGQILSQEVLDIPKIFPINIHASFLPKYRGAAPINWSIIRGDKSTGVSIIKVTRKMDSGPVILQREVVIKENDDSVMLEDSLRKIGSDLLMEALGQIKAKSFNLKVQDEKKVVLAPKLKKADGYIDWSRRPNEIHNLIRGTIPWPGSFTYFKNKLLKVYKSKSVQESRQQKTASFGEVLEVSKDEIIVACGNGALAIDELQLEGGKRMVAKDFIHGHKVKAGDSFGKK